MRLRLVAAIACLALPTALPAQAIDSYMIMPGSRVRVAVTETILPSPFARPGRLRRITGTVRDIAPDTIRLEVSADAAPVAIPRILIYRVERSLGRGRRGSAGDAAMMGGGIGALLLGFFREEDYLPVLAGGYIVGGLVGALRPYERWEEAWIPD